MQSSHKYTTVLFLTPLVAFVILMYAGLMFTGASVRDTFLFGCRMKVPNLVYFRQTKFFAVSKGFSLKIVGGAIL